MAIALKIIKNNVEKDKQNLKSNKNNKKNIKLTVLIDK